MKFVLCFLLQRGLRAGHVYVKLVFNTHTHTYTHTHTHTDVGKLSKWMSDGESCFIFTLWQVTPKKIATLIKVLFTFILIMHRHINMFRVLVFSPRRALGYLLCSNCAVIMVPKLMAKLNWIIVLPGVGCGSGMNVRINFTDSMQF
jgi:hypothetical protein